MANAPILIGGASVTVLAITNTPGGLAGLILLSQSGPAVTFEIDEGGGYHGATLPLTLNEGISLRITRTSITPAASVIQASYPEDPDGETLSLSNTGGLGAQKPPPYDQTTTPASVGALSIIYTGRGIGLRGLAFTVPVAASKIESIQVRDFDNNTVFATVDVLRVTQNDQNGISFPAVGLSYRTRLNINFTEPISLPTLAAPQLSPDTQVVGYDAGGSALAGVVPLFGAQGLSRRVFGPLSADALPVGTDPAQLYGEHTGHILAAPGQPPKLRFIHEGVTYAVALTAE